MHLDELRRVSKEQFEARRTWSRPQIVTGVTQGWPALARWSLDYLTEQAGPTTLRVRRLDGPPNNVYVSPGTATMTFGAFAAWIESTSRSLSALAEHDQTALGAAASVSALSIKETFYLDWPLRQLSAALDEDIRAPQWFGDAPKSQLLWCGVYGSSSGLHFDIYPNCNAQIRGCKHFVLFPPRQSKLLYPTNSEAYKCQFDPNRPDFVRFPLARAAAGVSGTLAEGECLYIPPGWYHQVTVVSPWSLNVNFWWKAPWLHVVRTPVLRKLLLKRGVMSAIRGAGKRLERARPTAGASVRQQSGKG